MARKAPWEVAYADKPADFGTVQKTEPFGRLYVFVWDYGKQIQPKNAGWRRRYEVAPPRDCKRGHRRVWSDEGRRARCPTCDTRRQRWRRAGPLERSLLEANVIHSRALACARTVDRYDHPGADHFDRWRVDQAKTVLGTLASRGLL